VRLPAVERGGSLADRLLYAIIRRASGFRAPDVVRTLRYRAARFGRPHSAHTRAEEFQDSISDQFEDQFQDQPGGRDNSLEPLGVTRPSPAQVPDSVALRQS